MQKETDIMLDKIKAAQSEMDEKCHDLFLNKEILAPVLKDTIEEYEGLTVNEIISLIDEASISKIEAVSDYPQSVNIQQIDTDLKSVTDKLVLFDIHFKAALPQDRQNKLNFQLYIDFEPQGIYNPGYPIIKRAMYYAARSLSRQLGEITEETDYGHLQKVYTIWVCYDPKIPKNLKNTVSRYKMGRRDYYGEVDESVSNYDLMEIVIVRIDALQESNIEIFDYLKGIFTNDREKIIKHTGPLSDEIIKEVDTMSGVGALIFDKGINEGEIKGREKERRDQIERLLKKGKTPEDIAEYNDYPLDYVKEIQESILVTQ